MCIRDRFQTALVGAVRFRSDAGTVSSGFQSPCNMQFVRHVIRKVTHYSGDSAVYKHEHPEAANLVQLHLAILQLRMKAIVAVCEK